MKSVLVAAMVFLATPVLADCVSCGPNGECYTTSPGFSGNCSCRIRSVNGMAVCRPEGVCDANDSTSCDIGGGGFPTQITSRFVNDLAQVNPLLAGAALAGVEEANSTRKARAEVKGTMGRDGKSYTYRAEVRRLSQDSISMIIEVQEDGAPGVQRYEGALANAGRSGRFLEVGAKGRSPVYSWDASKPR